MRLIKDFIDGRIVYFWESDDTYHITSPLFANLDIASEWYIVHCNELYEIETGNVNRRKSIIDRRRLYQKRDSHQYSHKAIPSINPTGRRHTDTPLAVAEDRATAKILDLMAGE